MAADRRVGMVLVGVIVCLSACLLCSDGAITDDRDLVVALALEPPSDSAAASLRVSPGNNTVLIVTVRH